MPNHRGSPEGWPGCDDDQVRVLLLGTYHMDNPGLDEVNVEADDVLEPSRQAELEALAASLASWIPDRIAVERPYDCNEEVNRLYDEYRSGERMYGREEEIQPPHPFREDLTSECRSEVVQVGFRLAEELDHEQVYPVDYPMSLANDEAEALEEQGFEPEQKTAASSPDMGQFVQEENRRLANSTIPEHLHWMNQEEQLAPNHEGMFGRYLRQGRGDNFGGPRMLSTWYDRNIRIVHNLWRAIESGDERLLLVVGTGHVRILRHLLSETPMFCPVSPLPYL